MSQTGFRWQLEAFDPAPNPAAVVTTDNARFTVLTPHLLRLEYSVNAVFEDRPSLTVWRRALPAPAFELRQDGDTVEIITDALHLTYRGTFSQTGLTIDLRDAATAWHYGDSDPLNLRGTTRTLDGARGPVPLSPGLVSRSGWAVLDDSTTPLLDDEGWIMLRPDPTRLDLYFFGHGTDYAACLRDYVAIAGEAPLLPRWALGNWWSRYWHYSDAGIRDLVDAFTQHDIPLSVFVIDMDWHTTETGNASSGWTGYTWNRELFPDPPDLLDWLHKRGLRTTLNVHPADGVWPHEEAYNAMSRELGIDPDSGQPVPFEIHKRAFAEAYLRQLHHPLEAMGVDFWWLDWQQDYPALPDLDPLHWLNHLHALDQGSRPNSRRFTFSRWGGWGNHRYPIGFSGDTYATWDILAFEVYSTATAANVNFGWWSHDIGGHFFGIQTAEMYLRWVQFGVLSPIMRLHSSKSEIENRHPWGYGAEALDVARKAMQLRHRLIPYLYAMSWRNMKDAIPPITPMYYAHPDDGEAYACPYQYYFGTELVAAPFVRPMDRDLNLSRSVVWLPEGDWYDFFTGEHYAGGTWHAIYGDLTDIPLFARAGGIVPLAHDHDGSAIPEALDVHCFAGADGVFDLYEDDGVSGSYREGAYSLTLLELSHGASEIALRIGTAHGDTGHLPNARTWTLHVYGVTQPESVTLTMSGNDHPLPEKAVRYDADRECVTVQAGRSATAAELRLILHFEGEMLSQRDRRAEQCDRMIRAFPVHTIIQEHITRNRDAYAANPAKVFEDFVLLNDAQIRALLEVVGGAGVDMVPDPAGGDFVIMWNSRSETTAKYMWSSWNMRARFSHEGGPIPRSQVRRVKHDRHWKLRANIAGMHTITLANAYSDYDGH